MPAPTPDYIFADVKQWKLTVVSSIDLPFFLDEVVDEVDDSQAEAKYEKLREDEHDKTPRRRFGQILGRFAELNGDMRDDAANACGGKPEDWLSLWKVLSSFESGLVISDFFLLHGMIRKRHLRDMELNAMYTCMSNG